MDDIKFLCKYPFLNEGKEYIIKKGLTIEKILNDKFYKQAIKISIDRILENFEQKLKHLERLSKLPNNEGYELWLLSYGISKMLINLKEIKFYKEYYIKEEANLFEKFIEKESKENKFRIIKEIVNYESKDGEFFVDFVDYLKYLKSLEHKENSQKLVNKILHEGKVKINEETLLDIAKNFVKEKFNEDLNIDEKELPEEINSEIKELSVKLKNQIEESTKNIVKIFDRKFTGNIPPSIECIIRKIKENTATNQERFALATYLLNVGMDIEKIKEIFSHSPKYNEKITEYYLKYFAEKKYLPYNYDKMKSLGMYVSEEEEKFKNPLAYIKKEKKEKE